MNVKSSPFSRNFSDMDLYEAWVGKHQQQIKIVRQAARKPHSLHITSAPAPPLTQSYLLEGLV